MENNQTRPEEVKDQEGQKKAWNTSKVLTLDIDNTQTGGTTGASDGTSDYT